MKRVALNASTTPQTGFQRMRLSLLLLLAVAWGHTRAATLCVEANDVAGLQAALVTAANNGQDDVVRLQSGHYFMPDTFLLGYVAAEQHDLTIEGGYGELFGDPCGLTPTAPDARQTVLDGGQLLLLLPDGAGSITLKSVTVSNEIGSFQNGGMAVQIGGSANATGNIAVYNSIFIGNSSLNNNAIFIVPPGTLLIQNSIFASNASFAGLPPIYIAAGGTGICAEITNSTFTNNVASTAAVDLYVPACLAIAANDIFWGNSSGDIVTHFPATTYLSNDDLGNLDEGANTQASNLLSVNPMFNSDLSLDDASPLRDAGSSGSFIFSPGEFDVIGNPRTYGTNPDIGAYEIQDVIFANGFD